jgi:hypothetical protein
MWKVSRVFTPVTVQKHHVIVALQLRKDVLSAAPEDTDAPEEAPLLESLFGEIRMLWVLLNRIHPAVGSSRGSHHGSRIPVATTDL